MQWGLANIPDYHSLVSSQGVFVSWVMSAIFFHASAGLCAHTHCLLQLPWATTHGSPWCNKTVKDGVSSLALKLPQVEGPLAEARWRCSFSGDSVLIPKSQEWPSTHSWIVSLCFLQTASLSQKCKSIDSETTVFADGGLLCCLKASNNCFEWRVQVILLRYILLHLKRNKG